MKTIVGFLGAGSMAEAIISGMTAKAVIPAKQIFATNQSNRERLEELQQRYGIQTTTSKQALLTQSDVIILAMKPKHIKESLAEIKDWLTEDHVVVSLLAGISTAFIEQQLPLDNPVIRVMPNTSAMIGESATTIAVGQHVTAEQTVLVEQLMQSIGTTTRINEADMDAFTAIAGSGPAFYYYMVEAIEAFVKDKGLDPEVAKPLINQTIKGVSEMLAVSTDSPAVLRKKITSPGGTTEAGLNTLADHQFKQAVIACLDRTAERSKEMREMFED
ncbi:pyrroline-5-carboxylate reductase [Gracilibacillus alcaliphilus]|uniref:pyrroline-5-carboxylate reductase n=1 Tax=Gracilibacillus alcaliphilus TaxID=1401441 RepID=UPI00195CF926|nr:pyrroline-5-carboxylate reductase [Gracilibacillus alcaliphilus]MBM7679094.1 pyrroline-5-carboxylate reductase [Gracilibacillus alcaliphilus]